MARRHVAPIRIIIAKRDLDAIRSRSNPVVREMLISAQYRKNRIIPTKKPYSRKNFKCI